MSLSLSHLYLASEGPTRALPMPSLAYGLIAFSGFLLLLGILWFFRGTAAKIAAGNPHVHASGTHAGDGHSDHQGGHH